MLPRRPPPPRGHGALLTWGLQRIQNLRRAVRRAQPTRQGWIFLAAMVAVALAAMNTGNNLLYLVLAAMLSLVGVSSVLSEWSIRDLQVSRVIEQEVFSGQWAAGRWELRNPRRFSPAIRVRVEEVAAGLAHLHGEVAVEFPLVAAGRTAVADARWCFEGRGIHRIEVLRISTSWPFGIFRKWYERAVPMDVLVLPAREQGGTVHHHSSAAALGQFRGASIRGGSQGDDLRGLEEHRDGQDPRQIHWRTSARRGRLIRVLREGEGQAQRVELRLEAPAAGRQDERSRLFEERVGEVSGRLWEISQRGSAVRLVLLGEALPEVVDAASRSFALRALALVELPAEVGR